MKNKLYLIFALFISVLTINIVNAKDLLTFDKTYDYSNKIITAKEIISIKDKLIILNDNYPNTELIASDLNFTTQETKVIENLSNASIIKHNDSFILVGLENNTMKVYQIDYNLKVLNQKETTYYIDKNSEFYLYHEQDKIYIMALEDEVLYSTKIYEIDNELNVTENNLSSYKSELLKSFLKSDYYLIHNNERNDGDRTWHYYASDYNKDYQVIVGESSNILYNDGTGFDFKARLVILDEQGEELVNEQYSDYNSFIDVKIVKNNIVVLATKDSINSLLIFDFTGKQISKIELSNTYNETIIINKRIFKANNKIIVYAEELTKGAQYKKIFNVYNFDCEIFATPNNNGTIEVMSKGTPYENIELKITPNSGYETSLIKILDSQGNTIPLINNIFVMPENDVYITVEYKEIVNNPETADIIIFNVILAIGVLATGIYLYKKLHWLK